MDLVVLNVCIIRTVSKLSTIQLNGDGKSLDKLMIMINEDIERIRVSLDISVCPTRYYHIVYTSFSLHSLAMANLELWRNYPKYWI